MCLREFPDNRASDSNGETASQKFACLALDLIRLSTVLIDSFSWCFYFLFDFNFVLLPLTELGVA